MKYIRAGLASSGKAENLFKEGCIGPPSGHKPDRYSLDEDKTCCRKAFGILCPSGFLCRADARSAIQRFANA